MTFKVFKACALAALLSGAASAQINIPSIVNVPADPSGTCASPGTPLQYNTQINHLSACQGASPGPYSWALVSGGGGSGSVTSVATDCGITGGPITSTGTIGQFVPTTAHNGSYAIAAGDCGASLTTNTTASWTIAAASTFTTGAFWILQNVGSGVLTLTATTSTFYGNGALGSSITVAGGFGVEIVGDGTNYQVLGGGTGGTTSTIFHGTATMGTGAISANSCASVVTVAATGVLSTDSIVATTNADVSGIVGYGVLSTDGLKIYVYPTAGDVNARVCNPTGTSITPGSAITLNVSVYR